MVRSRTARKEERPTMYRHFPFCLFFFVVVFIDFFYFIYQINSQSLPVFVGRVFCLFLSVKGNS